MSSRLSVALAFLLLTACSRPGTLGALFQKTTPHDEYARALDRAGLQNSALGRAWQQAAAQALRDSLPVTLPLVETGYFQPDQPTALSWRYAVRAGEQLHLRLSWEPGTGPAPRVFADAFALGAGAPEPLAWLSADSGAAGRTLDLRYRALADGPHLLRLQPELLAAGRFTLRLWAEPALSTFPVRGLTDAAVGSRWGDPRDEGRRRHEGLDIMAPRGTAAVAAGAGLVTDVGQNELGGRVVWLRDSATGLHLYYAHLDAQLVRAGQRVRAGQALGRVGTTGNARGTVPHLHFGIYGPGGPLDPWPFLHRRAPAPTGRPAGPDRRGQWVRLRPGAARAAGVAAALPLRVLGQRLGGGLRVEVPGGQRRYVAANGAEPARPLRRLTLPAPREVLAGPGPASPARAAWPAAMPVAVLGEAAGYCLVQNPAGELGWVAR